MSWVLVPTCVSLALVAAGGAVAGAGNGPAGPPASGVHVEVGDDYFEPYAVTVRRGGTVVFDHVGPSRHTATDDTGMGLYDSGVVGPGDPSTSYTFRAAGGYHVTCILHPWMGGRVEVRARALPARGEPDQVFTVIWAITAAPAGFVHDVQIRRPGRSWTSWRHGVAISRDTFVPDRGRGGYEFRARLRRPSSGKAEWSEPVRIWVR